ncbi:MAG TPA: GNAT family N-acetyltransferase [Candidatus Methylomirabilis sp.]|nr:GNAT family N-acetyltransferase [Candidatus Methylomirabilis sp.]
MSRHSLQRVWRVLRDEGARTFWFKLLGKLGYRRLYLLECSLAEPLPPARPLPAGLTLAWLPRSELGEYAALRADEAERDITARFDNGDRCLAARLDGQLVGAMWASVHRPRVQFLQRDVPHVAGDVYLFDAYVAAAARGQSIAPRMSDELLRHFQKAGSRRAIRGTAPENTPALRAHAKAGFRPYALIGYVKLGSWRRDFYRPYRMS